jgi:hypothetical protein
MTAVPAAKFVDRKVVLDGRTRDSIETRIGRFAVASRLLRQHDADADCARGPLPLSDDVTHRWIVWIDRLDDREPTGMGLLHFHRITGVVTVHGKGGDENRAVNADLVHRSISSPVT